MTRWKSSARNRSITSVRIGQRHHLVTGLGEQELEVVAGFLLVVDNEDADLHRS
jgi:hypothetical protein